MSQPSPLVTIIVPVYNSELYLTRCIDSILSQSMQDFELICVDDGSTDHSYNICKRYTEADNRVKLIYKENGGGASARNLGMEKARGLYIGFVDSDDWIDTRMYEMLLNAIEGNKADLAIANYWIDSSEEKIKVRNTSPINNSVFNRNDLLRYTFKRDQYKGFGAYLWNKLFKKSLLLEGNSRLSCDTTLKVGEDVWFFSNLAMKINKAVYIDQCLYHYVQRPNSLFHQKDLECREGSLIAYKKTIELFEKEQVQEDIIIWVRRFYTYHASLLAELAIAQKNLFKLRYYQQEIRRFLVDYIETNSSYPKRIQRINTLLEAPKK